MKLCLLSLWLASMIPASYAISSDHQKVTCSSAVKLTHKATTFKLHSHDVKYGSGSGQQVGSQTYSELDHI
jgi:hypothetical protein